MQFAAIKEYIIFALLLGLVVAAGAYLTLRANRFDHYYEIRTLER